MPYLPLVGILFMGTMPAALNLYWFCLAISNLACFSFFRTDNFNKLVGIPKYYENTIK